MSDDRDRIDDDVDAELRFHFDERVEALIAEGIAPAAARARAEAEFGDVRAGRTGLVAIDRRMHRRRRRREAGILFAQDVRQAVRRLARSPVFVAATVLTLALGIGAVTAVFGVVDAVALRPLPYPASDRVVRVQNAVPVLDDGVWGMAKGQYLAYREESRSFEALGLYRLDATAIGPEPGVELAEQVRTANVTASIADVVGARVSLGRLIRAEEELGNGAPVVVLSNAFWRRFFGGDPAVLGRTIALGGRPHEVIGVLEPGVRLPEETAYGERMAVDLWQPMALDPAEPAQNHHVFRVIGRLAPGVTPDVAVRELTAVVARFPETLPTAYSVRFLRETGFAPMVVPLREDVVGESARVLWILLGAVGVVLLIACANVANLFLVRIESRRRETAVRTVLGAARGDLARHFLAESLLIVLVAGALGLLGAWAALRLLVAAAPPSIPRLLEIGMNPLVVTLAFGLALAIGVVFGLLPTGGRGAAGRVLAESGRSTTPSRRRRSVRSVLVITQVGLCFALLAGAGLLIRSFDALLDVDPAFEPAGVLQFRVMLPSDGYPDNATSVAFYRVLGERVEALPGVTAVGTATAVPLGGVNACTGTRPMAPAAVVDGLCISVDFITPGLFAALGVSVRGREPAWADLGAGDPVAVVSAGLARRYWGDADPIGQLVRVGGSETPHRVVGVSADIRNDALDRPPVDVLYVAAQPFRAAFRTLSVFVRTDQPNPLVVLPSVRRVLAELDPRVALVRPSTMDAIVLSSMSRLTFSAKLLGIAAFIALFIGGIGIYGVVSYTVSQRTAEIGIRVALGARHVQVRRWVLQDTLRLAAIGIVMGWLIMLPLGRTLASLLYDVTPADPATLIAVALLLAFVALLAGWLPARRALRVDPVEALRSG